MKRFEQFQLDPVNECILRDGSRLALTRKAFFIARYLIDNAGRLVTKAELMDQIWPDIYVQEANLKVYIRELRLALSDHATKPLFIETRRGKGYCFIAPVSDESARSPAPIRSARPTRIFGRVSELKKLHVCFENALKGERQVVFITGEPGIGKTTLVDAFLRQIAQPALRAAGGQCVEGPQEQEAYYPVLEALGRLTRDSKVVETLYQYAPSWLLQFPSLIDVPERQHLQPGAAYGARQRMLREVCELIEALTQDGPLIISLEDVHWADPYSVAFIAALARRREPARLMLLVTYRPVDAILTRHPVRSLKMELQAHRLCTELALDMLDEKAVGQILTERHSGACVAEPIAELMHNQTDGNPLFLEMSLDYLEARQFLRVTGGSLELTAPQSVVRSLVPESLHQIIENYIDQLTAEEAGILTVASAAGLRFDAWTVAAMIDRDSSEVESRIDSLVQRQVFVERDSLSRLADETCRSSSYRFKHSFYREVFYRRCGLAMRRRLHNRMGRALEALTSASSVASDVTHQVAGSAGILPAASNYVEY